MIMYMIYDNVLGLLTMDTLIILNGVFVKFRLTSDQFLFILALPTNTCDYYRGVSVLFPESFTEKQYTPHLNRQIKIQSILCGRFIPTIRDQDRRVIV